MQKLLFSLSWARAEILSEWRDEAQSYSVVVLKFDGLLLEVNLLVTDYKPTW